MRKILVIAILCVAVATLTACEIMMIDTGEIEQTADIPADSIEPLDHFKCYSAWGSSPNVPVSLEDQFSTERAQVLRGRLFCNPVNKINKERGVETIIENPDHHLRFYQIRVSGQPQTQRVRVSNQFGENQELVVTQPVFLAVPTRKYPHPVPQGLDHFKCYVANGQPVAAVVTLKDQFPPKSGVQVQVQDPMLLCNPVKKIRGDEVAEIQNPDAHLTCYQITGTSVQRTVWYRNQFTSRRSHGVVVQRADLLCVPSEKTRLYPLDHFKCYTTEISEPVNVSVSLADQFGTNEDVQMSVAKQFCNPVAKINAEEGIVTEIQNPDHHLRFYEIEVSRQPQTRWVRVSNQFGENQALEVTQPVALAVPAQKVEPGGHPWPVGLDHFMCYEVSAGATIGQDIELTDQFRPDPQPAQVGRPTLLCNPVQKTHSGEVTEVQNPDDHLTCYQIEGEPIGVNVVTNTQFGDDGFKVQYADLLCVPSEKTIEPTPLDHFQCYVTEGDQPLEASVSLKDQFGTDKDVQVTVAKRFCNPAAKIYDETITEIQNPDHHLRFYEIEVSEKPQIRQVQVNNQFGEYQFEISQPTFLAVPTQKLYPGEHSQPEGLDHFKCYAINEAESVQKEIKLTDQFHAEPQPSEPQPAWVDRPALLCNPVQKTRDGEVTEIQNPDKHLTCYWLEIEEEPAERYVATNNQFGTEEFNATQSDLLCVPSQKTTLP